MNNKVSNSTITDGHRAKLAYVYVRQSTVWQVDLTGVNERKIPTPVDGSDPSWGPLLP